MNKNKIIEEELEKQFPKGVIMKSTQGTEGDYTEQYYKCVCGSEVLLIDSTYLKSEDEVYISLFSHYDETRTLKERIRWCWHILKTGRPYTDCIILHKTQISEIANHLKQLIIGNQD